MKALTERVVDRLKSRVDTVMWRHMQLVPFDLTHQECLDLVAPAEHHELLKTASQVAYISSHANWMSVNVPCGLDGLEEQTDVALLMRAHQNKEPPLRPRLVHWHSGVNSLAEQKVTNWLTKRLAHGRLASTTKFLLQHLDEVCDNGHQVRYLWPAVMHLFALEDADFCRRWVDKYGTYKAVSCTPHLEPEIRRALTQTSQWLTQGQLLADVRERETGEVDISLGSLPTFRLAGRLLTRN